MYKGRDLKQIASHRTVMLAILVGMYLIWWDSFHEIGRFFMQVPLPFDFILSRYSSASCLIEPAGVILGSILVCSLLRYGKNFLENKRIPLALFCLQAGLHVLYYVSASLQQYAISCLVYALVSMLAVPTILLFALQMRHFEKREIVMVVMGSIALYGIFNNLIFPCFLLTAPLYAIGITYLIALIAAFALSYALSNQGHPPSLAFCEPNHESSVRTPLPLVAHLLIYGLAFGILHIIGGRITQGPYSINIAVFFASLVTIACLAFLFLRKSSNHEIWSKIRSTVFPLSVIGYLLVPLVSNSDAALALTEAGNLLYNAIFVIGCFSLMRKTYVDPRTIIAKGLLYKSIGTLVGVFGARMLYESASFDTTAHSMLSIVIVSLLTVATFWVGSDEQIRKIWGLRKNLSAKQYNDRILQLKCITIAKDHRLTARESEILLLLAQGIRAPEIEDTLGISIDTVRSHIKHLYAKLDVHSFKDLHKLLKDFTISDEELK